MDNAKIDSVIESSFDSAFADWSNQIEKELYPSAFANEYSWIRVKNSLKLNNALLKEALKQSLFELLND